MNPSSLFAGLIFSGVGFVAFTYGKRMGNFTVMALGGALMAYSYFVPAGAMEWLIGLGLTAAVWRSWE